MSSEHQPFTPVGCLTPSQEARLIANYPETAAYYFRRKQTQQWAEELAQVYSNIQPMPLDYQLPLPPALPNPYQILTEEEVHAIYHRPGLEPIPFGTLPEETTDPPLNEHQVPRERLYSTYEAGESSRPVNDDGLPTAPTFLLTEDDVRRIVDERIASAFPTIVAMVKEQLLPREQGDSNSAYHFNMRESSPAPHNSETLTSPPAGRRRSRNVD